MLVTAEDYMLLTGKTLTEDERVRVNTLLKVAISKIENILGYSLIKEEVTEILELHNKIYLSFRPIVEVLNVDGDLDYRLEKNYLTVRNFENKPCCYHKKEISITYIKGYEEFPEWLKLELCQLVDIFENSLKEEATYTSYKIDDISYTMRDLSNEKREIIEGIVRKIYG